MGITWIIGILVFNRDLLFVAYIYTIFIGLQGLIIFILFVVLSKQVRISQISDLVIFVLFVVLSKQVILCFILSHGMIKQYCVTCTWYPAGERGIQQMVEGAGGFF